MSQAFRDCILGSAARGQISREAAEDILRRFDQQQDAGADVATAKRAVSDQLKAEAAERKRREVLATAASQRIAADLRAWRGPDGKADIVSAVTRLFENVGHTGYSSVRGRYNALLGEATARMEALLHAQRRSFLTLRRSTEVNPADIVKAAFGEETSPQAGAFYRSWLASAEKLREDFNAAGGAIGWQDKWGLPMAHDAGALTHAGFERWRDFIDGRLDWDAMRHLASDTPIVPGERDEVLRHVWESVVMDGWNTREPGGAGRPSLANSRQDGRFLKFRDAASWTDYNREFGRGNVPDVMMGHVNGMAKDVAAMQVLGPNPAATTQWLKGVIAQERAKAVAGLPSLFKQTMLGRIGLGRPEAIVDSLYEMARGSGLPRTPISQGFTAYANYKQSALLGSAVLTHAAINPLLEAIARQHYGIPAITMMGDLLKSLREADRRDVARMGLFAGDAMHTLERGARERGAFTRMTEATRWLPAITTHYSGLEAGVAALRRAWWWAASGEVTRLLPQDFDAIPDRQKALLTGFGIDGDDWAIMQRAKREIADPATGADFLRFQDIADVDDPRARDVSLKYLEMLHQSMEFAVPSSRWRSRVTLTGAASDGTLANLAARSFGMFKGFIGSATISYLEALRHEIAGNPAATAAYAGGVGLMLTALGTLVLQLKTLANGKDLLPMDPTTKDGRATLAHGGLTSGALSYYGDFLVSDQASFGQGPLEAAAGPMVGDAIGAFQGLYGLMKESRPGARPRRPGEAESNAVNSVVNYGRHNTPLLSSHWAMRAAYQRIVWDQLQFLIDPQAHRRMRDAERRLQKDTNQQYFWSPGEMLPHRWPQFTPGRP